MIKTKVTVAWYLFYRPKSMLASAIRTAGLHPRKELFLGSGIISPENRTCDLAKVMMRTGWKNYLVGGRKGKNASSGYHWAVYR